MTLELTRRLQALSIALEACSRLPGSYDTADIYQRIQQLIRDTLVELEQLITKPYVPRTPTKLDEEIPF